MTMGIFIALRIGYSHVQSVEQTRLN